MRRSPVLRPADRYAWRWTERTDRDKPFERKANGKERLREQRKDVAHDRCRE